MALAQPEMRVLGYPIAVPSAGPVGRPVRLSRCL